MKSLTQEEAREMLRKVLGPPSRELSGDEHAHIWMILQFLEPIRVTNNQYSVTEVYHQAGKVYQVHYFTMADEPVIEEIGNPSESSINIV